VPIWILGSSTYGAQLAAALGLPFAFASHFAPQSLHAALQIYRQTFRPSAQLAKPYVMVSAQVFAADTEAEARKCFSTLQQGVVNLQRGTPKRLQPPNENFTATLTPAEIAGINSFTRHAYYGTGTQVTASLHQFVEDTQADELMISSAFYDLSARLHSYEIVAQALGMG
jgi:luciferase family oxidoreductase group 1